MTDFIDDDEVLRRRPISLEARQRIDEIKLTVALRVALFALAEERGFSHDVLAEHLEDGDDILLSSVTRAVEKLGGRIELFATFPDRPDVTLLRATRDLQELPNLGLPHHPIKSARRPVARRPEAHGGDIVATEMEDVTISG